MITSHKPVKKSETSMDVAVATNTSRRDLEKGDTAAAFP